MSALDADTPRRGVFAPELLDRCISCGFCLPACPTYKRTGVESSSPRGRINLMRALEGEVLDVDDPVVREESSFCLGCRACEPVCPAGVQYGELLEQWRDAVWSPRRRSPILRAMLWAVESRWRVRRLGTGRRHARRGAADDTDPAHPWLMLGCFERGLFPKVSRAAARLVPGLRVTAKQGCCGALHAHNGESVRGKAMAQELGEQLPGTIVTTSGGCAAHLSATLGRDRVKELSEYLVETAPAHPSAPADGPRLRVTLQDSCHLRNGMGVTAPPRELLRGVGEYVELPSAGECCGAAGTYAILRPKDSRRVLDDKLDEIEAAEVDLVVAVNPGCLRQLQQGLKRRRSDVRAVHLAELLADRA